ncbi:MAG: chaplin [Pseudonocardiaceae bacterium]
MPIPAETRRFQSIRRLSAVVISSLVAPAAMLVSALPALADSGTQGTTEGSAGAVRGIVIQVPGTATVIVCGNTVTIVGTLDPAFGNPCTNA